MTEALYISKETKDTYSTQEVINIFNNSDNLDEIKKCIEKAEDRVFVSWASVDGIDSDKEKIPIDLVIKAQENLMKRGSPIMYRHTNKNVGKTLAYKVKQHPQSGRLGVLHLNLIYSGLPIDDEVWNDIKQGKLKGLSVGGQGSIGSKEYDENLKSMVDVYSAFGQYETSIVENPANPLARNEAVSAVAKEEKMTEEKQIQDIVKELSDAVSSLKEEVDTLKSSIKKEDDNVEPVTEEQPVEQETTEEEKEVEEPTVEDTEKEDNSLTIESLSKQVTELSGVVDNLVKSANKEEVSKEVDAVKEEKVVEVEKEDTITMEVPAVDTTKEEKNVKDVEKEYNNVYKDFSEGKISYKEAIEKLRA